MEILVDIIYLLTQGHVLSDRESGSLFFGVTKLLNTSNEALRRTVFLFLRHFSIDPNTGFILIGPLSTFIQSEDKMLKTNAFKIISKLIDPSTKVGIDQYIKVGISNTRMTADVTSSSVLCAYELTLKGGQIAKAWIAEINERLNNSLDQPNLVAYHTLLLLKELKSTDKIYLIKTFSAICNNIKGQFASCQLIRFICEVLMKFDIDDKKQLNTLHSYLETCCSKSSFDSVILESSRAILKIPNPKESMVKMALDNLKQLLLNYKKVIVYGTLKTLDEIAAKYSSIAIDVFLDLEKILENSNNNLSFKALALSIFLKISKNLSENRLDRMLKTITEQYALFKEDFKREIVLISVSNYQADSAKYKTYFSFFTSLLKLSASETTKLEIVEAITWFVKNVDVYKRQALVTLAEYVEDCPSESIKSKILLVIGNQSKGMNNLNQLVRHIYNRVIIEGPIVRSAAISALGEIANHNDSLKEKIIILIKNCLSDSDNEVRERAYFYYKALNDNKEEEIKKYIFPTNQLTFSEDLLRKAEILQSIIASKKQDLMGSSNINKDINELIQNPDIVNKIEIKAATKPSSIIGPSSLSSAKAEKVATPATSSQSNPDVDPEYLKTSFFKQQNYPKFVTSSQKLTEDSAEYKVAYKKYIYLDSVILAFSIENTVEESMLKNVSLSITKTDQNDFNLSKSEIIGIDSLKFGETKTLFMKLTPNTSQKYAYTLFTLVLNYDVQELDAKGNPHGAAYKDNHLIYKKIDIKFSDYMTSHSKINESNFTTEWNTSSSESESFNSYDKKLKLPYSSIKKAGQEISKLIGLQPFENLNTLDKSATKFKFTYAYESIYGTTVSIFI